MILVAYRLLVAPALSIALPFLALFSPKIRKGLTLRLRTKPIPDFPVKPIWIHASSGEFEYSKSVIRELKKQRPELPIVVTYFSPTFALNVENFPGVDFALPLPLDLPGPCVSFLNRVKPRALLIARTDLWPEMLTQVRRKGIPVRVFSYTQKDSGSRWLSRWRLGLVDEIDCVSFDDRTAIERLLPTARVSVIGDTRYDQVRFRLDHPKMLPAELKPNGPCLIAGSTWPEDEAVLLPALQSLLLANRLKLILVPHEPTPSHIEALANQLRKIGLTFALFSEQRSWNDKNVLLVDKVGVLAELYQWGNFAFVGGSFRKTVHSVMEALGAGLLTFVGPKHSNNREALEFRALVLADGRPGLQVVTGTSDFQTQLTNELNRLETLPRFKELLLAEFQRRLGATERLLTSPGLQL